MYSEKIWDAISGVAWPIVVIYIFVKTWPSLRMMLDSRRLSIKVAGIELSVADAAENIGKQVADIQQKVAEIDQKLNQYPPKENESFVGHSVTKEIFYFPKSVLWVDDYPSNNAFLIDKFQRSGIDVTVSLSTEDALKHISQRKFAVVITDLGRTENGLEKQFAGLELIERLRKDGSDVPILVFAGARGLQNRDKLLAAGANEVSAAGTDVISFVEQYVSVGT